MGTEQKSNCCNVKVLQKDGKTVCAKCEQILDSNSIHDVNVKSTVKLGLQNK